MAFQVRRVDYFHAMVADESGAACDALTRLAEHGVNLLAFTTVPMGPMRTQLTLFPAEASRMLAAARDAGLRLDGPHPALLVQGDDELGALAKVHQLLCDAGVEVYASSGVSDGGGSYGYVLYVRPQDIDKAVDAAAGA
ncbi:MAG TPA: hypothetical protein VFZ65_08285 [Planctomycetota bacterium]|nr:hypothetical protein [Planctomycetota bacterium]